MDKNIIKRIIKWNKERGLDKKEFDIKTETINIIEELIEMSDVNVESNEARERAEMIVESIIDQSTSTTKSNTIDALCDIIVYATGALLKLGVDPECAMDETLKEIESRTGKIINGKFVKDTSEEAKKRWYKADYKKCY